MTFTGFGGDAVGFWEGLAADNSKAYWQAHKDTYDRVIAGPLIELCEALEPEFGALHRFRPQRDVRFSADKRPYQEFCSVAGTSTRAGSGVLYLQLSLDGLMLAGGAYQPSTATLGRFRTAVDDPPTAASFDDTITSLTGEGFDLDGDPLKTAPRGSFNAPVSLGPSTATSRWLLLRDAQQVSGPMVCSWASNLPTSSA